jgi:transcription elongation factor Elf1
VSHDFEVGAWTWNDTCPACHQLCCFSTRFKKMGEHDVRACSFCKLVFHNGEPSGLLKLGAPPEVA